MGKQLIIDDMKGVQDMQITDVRIRKVEKEGKMKAVVSITMDDEFVVHDIKVIEGENVEIFLLKIFNTLHRH